MKKSILVFALLLVAFLGKVSAQRYQLEDVMVSSIKMNEGANIVHVPNGRGTIRFVKRGENFSNVMFQDAAGKIVRLNPNEASEGASPSPACKCPLPDACFATAEKNIGMCMCKPCNLSNGDGDGDWSLTIQYTKLAKSSK
jgi:hypothetical protein